MANRPPSEAQARFELAEQRIDIGTPSGRLKALAVTDDCQDIKQLISLSAERLPRKLVSLPDSGCLHNLFRLSPAEARGIYSRAKLHKAALQFVQEARSYNGHNLALLNLTLYLRAGYYLVTQGQLDSLDPALRGLLRPAITLLIAGSALYLPDSNGVSAGAEIMRLISNMHDEAHYLNTLKLVVHRYTNRPGHPVAALALRDTSVSQTFTGLLSVFYYAHLRPDAVQQLHTDAGLSAVLYQFVQANRDSLIETEMAFQLGDTARESLRFLQYRPIYRLVKPQVHALLSSSSMTGADNELWLAAASAVKNYDEAHCADYAACNIEAALARAILPQRHACDPVLTIRSQEMTVAQMQSTCALLRKNEAYFHRMLQTHRQPLLNDFNHNLEIVVFNDYNSYSKYAPLIFGVRTDNGGMYIEGDPARPGNQARFIAHEASWLRPRFQVWNLEHEYVHYLDGRFNLYGDFHLSTQYPIVWWTEGLAEYLSLRNRNQPALDAARSGNYQLSSIFSNNYRMHGDIERIYRWGYLATRFMFEKHHADVDLMLSRFRAGNYAGYQRFIEQLGNRYDAEFASWARQAADPAQPLVAAENTLPACREADTGLLEKGCSINDLASNSEVYASIWIPSGARNLKFYTQGGQGNVDLYLAAGRYPSADNFDQASVSPGNQEHIHLASAATGRWYYLTLSARQPFHGVSVRASFD